MKLERVLTKLKFDESVNGYALITSDGHPFLSFSLPDEVLPQIKGTLRIHGSDLRLVNIMTGEGFEPDFQLGGALSRTKAVVDLLQQVDLPPPPAGIAEEEEVIPLVEEEPLAEMESAMTNESVMEETTTIEPIETMPAETPDEPPKVPVDVRYGCVVHRGENYKDSVTLDTKLNVAIKKEFANVGIDILLVVDEKMTVYRLAEHLARAVDKVISIVKWCISQDILWVECPEEQETAQKEIIELPLFEGKIDKVKKKHRPVLELCDGRTTLQEIATELGIPYFEALQSVVPYRGKTVKFIRTDKLSRF